MNTLKAPSLHSLLDSDHGSNDSLLAESLQLDIEEVRIRFPVLECARRAGKMINITSSPSGRKETNI